jgi:hypothetical protein
VTRPWRVVRGAASSLVRQGLLVAAGEQEERFAFVSKSVASRTASPTRAFTVHPHSDIVMYAAGRTSISARQQPQETDQIVGRTAQGELVEVGPGRGAVVEGEPARPS